MLRWIGRTFAALIVVIVLIFAGGYLYLLRSLPQMNGTIAVGGITGPVDIIRDADSITHVFGISKLDTYFGLGYAHAQDRLWQMEFQRRVGMGRLSEVLGPATVNTDRFLRTLGTNRAAKSAWDTLAPETKTQLNAYVAGVNAFISTHHGGQLPMEFTLLRFEPEPWTGADVLAWVKMMAWDLSKNYTLELLMDNTIKRVGPERTKQLFPGYPADGIRVLQDKPPFLSSAVESLPLLGGANALGSNNWVVDGTMTASGKPLLANDPHLDAQIPSLWYLAHLSAGDFDVIGATLPGAPAVVIGRNRYIAWGETNVMADVQDLYHESPAEPLRTITEHIVVKGSAAIDWPVRVSRHGPIVSDAISANEGAADPQAPRPDMPQPIAFRWTALDPEDSTVTSILRLNEARNWNDFTSSLGEFVVPPQNFVYADVGGHIGYYAAGRFPVRQNGEWNGFVPFGEQPHVFDPPRHFIVTANNKITDDPRIEGEWIDGYRAERITQLLTKKPKLTPDDFAAIQADTYSLHAKALVPLLLQRVHPIDAADAKAVDIVKQWDFDARGDSAASAIVQAWFLELSINLTADKIRTSDYMALDKTSYRSRFVMNTIAAKDNAWCDDVRTPARETCDDAVSASLHAGVARLTKAMGPDMSTWRWDTVHHAIFAHPVLDGFPVLGRWLRREVPHGGDWSTVNVGPVHSPNPFDDHSLPGYREILDLSPANDNRFLDAVGQSGHVLSPHYDDALPLWSAVKHRKMRMERADAEAGAIGHLRLAPR